MKYDPDNTSMQIDEKLTGNLDIKYKFSKNGQNVLIIFFDRFIGGYVKEVITDIPKLKTDLSGFTWYPNTISPGTSTKEGLPPLYSGLAYTELHKNDKDKWAKYTNFMLNKFSKKGFHAFINDPSYTNEKEMNKISKGSYSFEFLIEKEKYMKIFYPNENAISKNQTLKPVDIVFSYLLPFSVFKISPPFKRKDIYNNGKWLNNKSITNNSWIKSYIHNLAFLKSLPFISEVDPNIKGSYNFVTSFLAHNVYAARDNGRFQTFIDKKDKKDKSWQNLMKTGDFNENHIKRFKDNYSIVHFYADKRSIGPSQHMV